MELTKFKIDSRKEQEGVWRDFGGGAAMKIAKVSSPRYRASIARFMKKYTIQGISGQEENVDKATVHAMAESILIGWKGLTEDGKEVPYSVENAIQILTDYPEIRELVSEFAISPDNFRPEEVAKK